ncbi:hypothetical protein N9043_00585 [bacterium]|nr:hypothetical protein [bacterium]
MFEFLMFVLGAFVCYRYPTATAAILESGYNKVTSFISEKSDAAKQIEEKKDK